MSSQFKSRRMGRLSYRRLHFEQCECRRLLTSGDLDLTFGNAGIVTTEFDGSKTSGKIAYATAIQTDGKIVATGDGAMARYNIDGSLDLNFGDKGKVAIPFAARDVALQSNGGIVVVGSLESNGDMAVARFLTNGQPDATFDADGLATTDLGGEVTSGVVIQPDGMIVVSGNGRDVSGRSGVAAVRYRPNGMLDTTFGVHGKAVYYFSRGDIAVDVTLQADGKLVLAGQSLFINGTNINDDFLVVRLRADGTLDRSFDQDGWLTRNVSTHDQTTGLIVQSNGNIIISGTTNSFGADTGVYVARFLRNGSTDTTFDGDGMLTDNFQLSPSRSDDLVVTPTGQILVVGTAANRFALVQYNADGTRDSSFGVDGKVLLVNGVGKSVSRQPNGSFVVGGVSQVSFGLARFQSNGTLDTTFNFDGLVQTEFGPSRDLVGGIAVQPDLKTVVVGQSGKLMSLARYKVDGSLDATFGTGGKITLGFGDQYRQVGAASVALQSDGKIVVAGFATTVIADSADADFLVARFLANGMLDTSFSADGWLTTDSFGYEKASSILVQPDGKIVIGGSDNTGFAFVRYTAAGLLDNSFSNHGKRSLRFGPNYAQLTKILLQPDGAIVGVGNVPYSNSSNGSGVLAVVRLLPNGTNDLSFNGTGLLVDQSNIQRLANDAALQPDGSILIAGGTYFRPRSGSSRINTAVTKLLPNGTHDPAFGINGTSEIILSSQSKALSIAVQSNGRIVLSGDHSAFSGFVVARLNIDGSLDSSFAGDGIQQTKIPDGGGNSADLALLSDGRIIVAGNQYSSSFSPNDSDFILARYRNDAEAPASTVVFRNANGAIEIQDQWQRDDLIEFTRTGNNLILTDKTPDKRAVFTVNGIPSIGGSGTKQISIPLGLLSSTNNPLIVGTSGGDDRIELNTNDSSSNIFPKNLILFDAGAGNDHLALVNSTTDNIWKFYGGLNGLLTVGTLGQVTFAGVENSAGGDGNDLFRLVDTSSNEIVSVNGNGGYDTFEVHHDADMTLGPGILSNAFYTFLVKSNVEEKYQIAGMDALIVTGGPSANVIDMSIFLGPTTIDGLTGDDRLLGGGGDDTIKGGGGNDVVFGNSGDDTIYGDTGNDILMGSSGADLIYGGEGDDLITGAYFASLIQYNREEARAAIIAAWFSNETYAQRIERLTVTGVGPNNSVKLLPNVEAFNDTAVDTLIGNAGQDWFFASKSVAANEFDLPVGGLRDLKFDEVATAIF